MTSTAQTHGVHHVGLTVLDVEASARFFETALGFERVAAKPAYPAIFVSDGTVMLTLWQAERPSEATPFDRKQNLGLHHVALNVADHAALEGLHTRLAATDGVRIEFPPEALGAGGARHMMLAIPCGVRLELISAGK